MTRNSKRAFTLVELIIVIAVIGVLAAILIPVFSNVVNKANIADKTSLARNLNSMIAAEKEEVIDVSTMQEAMIIAHKQGYTDEQIFNTKTAGTIVFNTQTGNFAVATDVENGVATLAYADQGKTTAPAAALFTATDVTEIPAPAEQVFGMYLVDSSSSPVTYAIDTAVSVDVGDVAVSTINFATTESGDFTFRTVGGTLNIDAANANVNHYGYADFVNITAVAMQSYHEFGRVTVIKIDAGHVVIEAGATVLNGIKPLTGTSFDVSAVKITLNAAAAVEGDHIANLVSGTANVVWSTTPISETIGFAGGDGTKNNPYLIATAKQFENIATNWYSWSWTSLLADYEEWLNENAYIYYKVMDGISKIDLSNITVAPKMCGVFDGNGCTFTGVKNIGMFTYVGAVGAPESVVKNFTVDAYAVNNGGYHLGVVCAGYCIGDAIFENLTAHGYVEAPVAASFISYGNAAQGAWHVTFKNCVSDMTLVSTSENAGGFVAHQYCGANSVLTFENSKFVGKMTTVSGKKVKYFTAMDYASAQIVVKTNEVLPISGVYGEVGEHTLRTETAALYTATANLSTLTKGTLVDPGKYNTFSAAALSGATHAKATLVIGPNGLDETGNFTGTFMQEECKLTDGTFSTEAIKYFDITVNGDATPRTGVSEDGKIFNIVSADHGTTWGSASVTIFMYDANNNIVGLYTMALAH